MIKWPHNIIITLSYHSLNPGFSPLWRGISHSTYNRAHPHPSICDMTFPIFSGNVNANFPIFLLRFFQLHFPLHCLFTVSKYLVNLVPFLPIYLFLLWFLSLIFVSLFLVLSIFLWSMSLSISFHLAIYNNANFFPKAVCIFHDLNLLNSVRFYLFEFLQWLTT